MEHIKHQIEEFFKDLTFNEASHTYKVNGEILPSVSGLIKNFVKPFDSQAIAAKTAARTGQSVDEILESWKKIAQDACDHGHTVHEFGEHYPFDRSLKPRCEQERSIVAFWNDIPDHIVPLIMELRMYHKELKYAGTADIVLLNLRDNSLILGDYKTNKDLFKNYRNKTLLAPFEDLLDCPFNKYQLQLSYYQQLLEQTGLKVSGKKLIWLLRDGTYKMYDTNDYRDKLTAKSTSTW